MSKKKASGKKKKIVRKKKSLTYTVDTLEEALHEISTGKALNETARKFGIPKSTLSVKFNNKVPLHCKKGPSTILTKSEEDKLVEWIIESSKRGFPVTKSRLLENIQKFILQDDRDTPFKNGKPGRHWFDAFMRRNPVLSQRISQNLTTSRAAVTEIELRKWFSIVKENLEKKNLVNIEPSRVFNLDESSFRLVPKMDKVIAKKGVKNIYNIVSSNEKGCVTVLFSASANGRMAPPLVLFEMKIIPTSRRVLQHIPKGWGVGNTEGGWMTGDSFYSYIKNIFYPWLLSNDINFPVILYVDNHTSHINLPLLQFCKDKGIELIALYPNSTHIIQPLDVAFFHPLKAEYKLAVEKYKLENNIIDLKKFMVAPIIQIALESRNFEKSIANGFKSSGLLPFDANAVNYNILSKESRKRKALDVIEDAREENSTTTAESNSNNKSEFCSYFETNFIPKSTLEEFKKNEFEQFWSGDLTQKALFEAWRAMRKECVHLVQRENETESDSSFKQILNPATTVNFSDREDSILNVIQENYIESNNLIGEHILQTVDITEDSILQYSQDSDICNGILTVEEVQITNEFGESGITPIMEENYMNAADNVAENQVNTLEIEYNLENIISPDEESALIENNLNLNNEVIDLSLEKDCTRIVLQECQNKSTNESFSILKAPVQNYSPDEKNNSDNKGIFNEIFNQRDPNLKMKKKTNLFEGKSAFAIDDLIENARIKEEERQAREEEIRINKEKKDKSKIIKEKETMINKSFKEIKNQLMARKRSISQKIKDVKHLIKNGNNRENIISLKEELKYSIAQIKEVERLITENEMNVLKQKIEIKQERL